MLYNFPHHPPAYQPPRFPPLSEPALSHIYIWRLGRGEGWYAGGKGLKNGPLKALVLPPLIFPYAKLEPAPVPPNTVLEGGKGGRG